MFKLLSTWQRTFLLAVLCCLVSLAVVVIALNLAVWGAPLPIFLFLLGWLLTVGLPTSLSVVLVMSFWRGGSVEMFSLVVVSLALVLTLACLVLLRQIVMPGWRTKP